MSTGELSYYENLVRLFRFCPAFVRLFLVLNPCFYWVCPAFTIFTLKSYL